MPRRDRSAEAVAREWLGSSGPETVHINDIARLIVTTRRAERARVRRIVRRECEAIMDREQVNAAKARYAKRELVATCREAGEEVATECRDRILAALRKGKGTR